MSNNGYYQRSGSGQNGYSYNEVCNDYYYSQRENIITTTNTPLLLRGNITSSQNINAANNIGFGGGSNNSSTSSPLSAATAVSPGGRSSSNNSCGSGGIGCFSMQSVLSNASIVPSSLSVSSSHSPISVLSQQQQQQSFYDNIYHHNPAAIMHQQTQAQAAFQAAQLQQQQQQLSQMERSLESHQGSMSAPPAGPVVLGGGGGGGGTQPPHQQPSPHFQPVSVGGMQLTTATTGAQLPLQSQAMQHQQPNVYSTSTSGLINPSSIASHPSLNGPPQSYRSNEQLAAHLVQQQLAVAAAAQQSSHGIPAQDLAHFSLLSPSAIRQQPSFGAIRSGNEAAAAAAQFPIQMAGLMEQHHRSQLLHQAQHSQPTPTSADACLSIVHSLMCHRQGGDESFARRAIDSLIKKLKDKREELDALIAAVTTNGAQQTKCVTIQRTLDGRLQVAGRKGFPHVIYAKIWRWPDLHKNELKHIQTCEWAFDKKLDNVCVNPYHYERVVAPGLGNLDLSALRLDASTSGSCPQQHGNGEFSPGAPVSSAPSLDDAIRRSSQYSPGLPSATTAAMGMPSVTVPNNVMVSMMNQSAGGVKVESTPGGGPDAAGSIEIKPSLNFTHKPGETTTNVYQGAFDGAVNTVGAAHWTQQLTDPRFTSAQTLFPTPSPSWASAATSTPHLSQPFATPNQLPDGPLSNTPQPECWCSIDYYEMDQHVGETFKCPRDSNVTTNNYVSVDGGTDPAAPNRFCLGALSNVHRTDGSDKVRQHIQKGIELTLQGEGDVWLKNISNHVFVCSFYLDSQKGLSPGDAVHKIYPDANIKVFDLRSTYDQIQTQATLAREATIRQARAVVGGAYRETVGPNNSAVSIGVDDLRRLCRLRISFVKGWGPDYKRKSIKETPCWIEVHLHRALQLLDEVLQKMDFPTLFQ